MVKGTICNFCSQGVFFKTKPRIFTECWGHFVYGQMDFWVFILSAGQSWGRREEEQEYQSLVSRLLKSLGVV